MDRTETIIVGAGQAGLASSRCLTDAGRDHVLFDRGDVAQRWRTERWDSLRLLTPNWMTRLPGWRYQGPDPDGFMSVPQLVTFFERYATSFGAPLRPETTVERISPLDGGYRVETNQGPWLSANVVIATGIEGSVRVPAMATHMASSIRQVPSNRYRNPSEVGDGGVLVVGASATGIQLADELAATGRNVVLSVGTPRGCRVRMAGWTSSRGLIAAACSI